MAAYSQDLRQRVIDAVERNEGSIRQIAARFVVSLSFVVRLLQTLPPHRLGRAQAPCRADVAPPWGRTTWSGSRSWSAQQPDATLEELRQRLGVACSLMAIWRALEKLGLPRKKKVLHADEQDSPEVQEKRRAFREELAGVDPQRLVFVDESGANTAMTRTYGRAPVGRAGLRESSPATGTRSR